jgi:hypothetical protein
VAKKTETKGLLTGKPKAQGWRDQFAEGQQEEPEPIADRKATQRYRRKTYLMSDELIRRIETQAKQMGVGVNEMNRYLLTLALDLVESGSHKIPVQTVEKHTLGV